MAFAVGSRVVAPLNKRRLSEMGSGPLQGSRRGVIEEVLRGDPAPRYWILWDTGERSVYAPTGRGLRAENEPA